MIKLKGNSKDLIAENIKELKQLFPEAFTEGKVDFKALKEVLGDYIEDDKERYSFNWAGKQQARREAQKVSTGTLRPCREESVNFDTTENLYIEGDNLEVLKLLQKSYHNQVKMIYIDPPYNTGKDFVYKDNYRDNLKNYKELTGQIDSDGNKLSTNSDSAGRYHSNWLNMMFPRLKLARNLLKDDGVIFISIDDNEVHNLRKICDEIFGEDNLVGEFIWKKRTGSNDATNMVSIDHDYVISYSKKSQIKLNGTIKDTSNYRNIDNDPRGAWAKDNLTCNKTASERPNLYYPIIDPQTGTQYECNKNRVWAYEEKRMLKNISDGKVLFPKQQTGTPMYKRHLSELRSHKKPFCSLIKTVINTIATKETRKILNGQFFDYPKSVDLIAQLITQGSDKNDIILDFFAGSSTTAHAVLDLNKEDGGNRKFIMVQLPEPTAEKSEAFKAGYKTIAEIGKERIRRVVQKIHNSELIINNLEDEQLTLSDASDNSALSITNSQLKPGFKVLKLDSSNVKSWDTQPEDLEEQLLDFQENIKADRTEEDILYEILLKYGLELVSPIDNSELIIENESRVVNIYNIGMGALIVCLDSNITLEVVEYITKLKEESNPESCRVVFRDNGFKDDVVKTNAMQILVRHGIDEIRSI